MKHLAKLRQHKKEEPRKETCEHCKYLYYNSDGSVSCNSPFEKACLTSGIRMFKEMRQVMDNKTTPNEAFWQLVQSLEMDALLDHAEYYFVKPIEKGCGESAVFNAKGELVDDRGELFWALAHLVCHIVPNVEFRSKYQTRYDESGEEYFY